MKRIPKLEHILTDISGNSLNHKEHESIELLEEDSLSHLLQKVWDNGETIYAHRSDGTYGASAMHRDSVLFKSLSNLIYEDLGNGPACADSLAHSMELWVVDDVGFIAVSNFFVETGGTDYITEFRLYKGDNWLQSEFSSQIENLIADLATSCSQNIDSIFSRYSTC